ncbi:hypothetical protein J3R83DRAFT_11397 [Lanmaoa asiatica]|nr:hypothetical protein J3R83DRAFT_11397 [Lanmaoa asiatica]
MSSNDNDDDSSDASSTLTELRADEFPGYFREHGGRFSHSYSNSPYPLPVDGKEQTRVNAQHMILHDLLRSHFVGPVAEALAYESGRHKCVLDFCTGTGQWNLNPSDYSPCMLDSSERLMDMASQFRHVRFSGVDIVPIATRHPHPSAHFEILDVTQPFRRPDGVMDFVHARSVSLATSHSWYPLPFHHSTSRYPTIGRCYMRLLVFCDVAASSSLANFAPGYLGNPAVDAPGATRFFKVVNDLLEHIGLHEIPYTPLVKRH